MATLFPGFARARVRTTGAEIHARQGGDGGFRRIKVKMTDAAADAKYNLRYRTGYFADTNP